MAAPIAVHYRNGAAECGGSRCEPDSKADESAGQSPGSTNGGSARKYLTPTNISLIRVVSLRKFFSEKICVLRSRRIVLDFLVALERIQRIENRRRDRPQVISIFAGAFCMVMP